MTPIEELEEVIEAYITLFHEMAGTEERKLEAAKTYDVEGLNECIKQEQAYVLQIRGFEKRRLSIMEALSFKDKSFQDILPLLPDERRDLFKNLYQRLQQEYGLFTPIYGKANEMLKENGHKVEDIIADLDKAYRRKVTYAPDGQPQKAAPRSMKNMKI